MRLYFVIGSDEKYSAVVFVTRLEILAIGKMRWYNMSAKNAGNPYKYEVFGYNIGDVIGQWKYEKEAGK